MSSKVGWQVIIPLNDIFLLAFGKTKYQNCEFFMKTLSGTAYRSIRKSLIDGKLPLGSKISEAALAREMGISRAPVREAIRTLANEGLIHQVPNAGCFVKEPDRRELEELFELREWLEAAAAEKAAGQIDASRLAELEHACSEMRSAAVKMRAVLAADPQTLDVPLEIREQFEVADAAFHMILIESCDNRRVISILANQHIISRMWKMAPFAGNFGYFARMYGEHARVFRAIKRGDRIKARNAMIHHIQGGRHDALSAFDRARRERSTGYYSAAQWPASIQEKVFGVEEKKSK